MTNRKILFVIPKLGGGGGERVVMILSNYFSKLGYDVNIILVKDSDENTFTKYLNQNIKLHFMGFDGRISHNPIRFVYILLKKIVLISPNVLVLASGSLNSLVSPFLFFLPNSTKKIARETNLVSLYEQSKFSRLFYKLFINNYDKVVFQSEDMKDDFINNIKRIEDHKWVKINNPIDTDFIDTMLAKRGEKNLFPNDGALKLLAVGRLTYQKNFKTLINTLSKVTKREWCLYILGSGDEENMLRAQIDHLNLSKKVKLVGSVDNPYIYYQEADFYLSSSRWEGFPNSVLESLYCGTPVIANAYKGGINEIINSTNGCVIDITCSKSLGEALNLEHYKSELVKKTSEKFFVKNIASLYESLFS